MRRLAGVALVLLAIQIPASAALLYNFQANPQFSTAPAEEHPISFSFTSPNFVKVGDPLPPISFNITDGTTTWTIMKAATVTLGGGGHCFLFGTSDYTLPNGAGQSCEIENANGKQAAFFFFSILPDLPAVTGHYAYDGFVASYAPPTLPTSGFAFDFSTAILDISGTPGETVAEPGSGLLLALGFGSLLLVGIWRRSRSSIVKPS